MKRDFFEYGRGFFRSGEEVLFDEEVGAQRTKGKYEEGPEITEKVEGEEKGREKQEELTRQICGVSHTTEEAKGLVFLPNREERPFNIEIKVKLRVKVIPASEPSTRFIVKETEKEGNKEEGK